jgi:hypothetical protein
MPFGNSGM